MCWHAIPFWISYLVGLVGGGGGGLALLARGELGEVTVVVTLPVLGESVVNIKSKKEGTVKSRLGREPEAYILW